MVKPVLNQTMIPMNVDTVKSGRLPTPALVVDQAEIIRSLQSLMHLRQQSGCKVLYSIKSLPLSAVLATARPYLDGFSVSSLFEARLAKAILGQEGDIHLTTPGIRADEWAELGRLCTHISFNSISQFQHFSGCAQTSVGLRINPKLSFVKDERYDPCRKHSKLGAAIDEVWQSPVLGQLRGLHVHTNFGAKSFQPLVQTVGKIESYFSDKLAHLDWLNIGGGYLFNEISDTKPFVELVKQLNDRYGLAVYIEPGKAVVGKAGYLFSTVIDLFVSDGKTIAVLDTSVNHQPEVFEYQMQPELYEHNPKGAYAAQLVGSTCLAGDILGDYRFSQPLQLGDQVVFKDLGAYSLIKASRFNGYNLPAIYLLRDGQPHLAKQYDYQDFRQQWWAE